MRRRSIRGFLWMLAAWPLGLVLAVVWLFVPWPGGSHCAGGQACALQPVSLFRIVLWICLALAPGVWATVRWWRGEAPAA